MDYFLTTRYTAPGDDEYQKIYVPLYEEDPVDRSKSLEDCIEETTQLYDHSFYDHTWCVVDQEDRAYAVCALVINGQRLEHMDNKVQPFLMLYGFAQFQVEVEWEKGIHRKLTSKLCSVVNRTDSDNLQGMIRQVLNIRDRQIQELLKWPSDSPGRDAVCPCESEKYSMLSGANIAVQEGASRPILELVETSCGTYQKHGGYFLTHPEFTVKKEPIPVSYHKVKQLTRDSMLWSVKNGAMRPVPAGCDKGIPVHGLRYFPAETLSEIAQKDYRIYENQVVIGFLDTLQHGLENHKYLSRLRSKNDSGCDGFSLVSLIFLDDDYDKLGSDCNVDLLSKDISVLRSRYLNYLHLEERDVPAVSSLPRQTKRFMEIQPYRDIYHCIAKWFQDNTTLQLGNGAIFKGRLADTIYEYFCWLQLLNVFVSHGWVKRSACDRVKYTDNYEVPPFSNIVYLKNDQYDAKITLYFTPFIPNWNSRVDDRHGITLRRVSMDNLKKDLWAGYTPDFMIKVKRGDQVSYAILDAKFRSHQSLFEKGKPVGASICTMKETIYKYYLDVVSTMGLEHPVSMVWLLFGLEDTDTVTPRTKSTLKGNGPIEEILGYMPSHYLDGLDWAAASLNYYNKADWRENFWQRFEKNMLK